MSQNKTILPSLKLKRKFKFKNSLEQIIEENQHLNNSEYKDSIFTRECIHDSLITYTNFPSLNSNNIVFKKWNGDNKSHSIILPAIFSNTKITTIHTPTTSPENV